MGVYVNVIEEVSHRLVSAMGAGKKLDSSTEYGLKRVLVGNRAIIDGINVMPCALISDSDISIQESYDTGVYRKLVGEVSVAIIIKYPIKDELVDNRLYNTGASTGFLYFVERVLDVLNETSGQSLDPRVGQNSFKPVNFSVNGILTSGPFIQCELSFSVQTGLVSINSRAT